MIKKTSTSIFILVMSFLLTSCSAPLTGYITSLTQLYEKAQDGITFERDYTFKVDAKQYALFSSYNPDTSFVPTGLNDALTHYQIEEVHIKIKGSFNLATATGHMEIYTGFDAPATERALEVYLLEDKQLYVHKNSLIYLQRLATTYPELISSLGIQTDSLKYISILLDKLKSVEYMAFDFSEEINDIQYEASQQLLNNKNRIQDLLQALMTLSEGYESAVVTQSGDTYTLKLDAKTLFDQIKGYRNYLINLDNTEFLSRLKPFDAFLAKYYSASEPLSLQDVEDIKELLSYIEIEKLDSVYTSFTLDNTIDFNLVSTIHKDTLKHSFSWLFQGKPFFTFSSEPIETRFTYTPISTEKVNFIKSSFLDMNAIPFKYAAISFKPGATKGYLLNATDYEVVDLINLEGTYYVPCKPITNLLGQSVTWNPKSKSAYATIKDKQIPLQGIIKNGTFYLKVRELEKLGFIIDYSNQIDDITLYISEIPFKFSLMPLVSPPTRLVLIDGAYVEIDLSKPIERYRKVLTEEDIVLLTTDTDSDGLCDFIELYLLYFDGTHYQTDISNPDTDYDGLLDGEEIIWDITDTLFSYNDQGEPLLKIHPGDILIFYSSLDNTGYITFKTP